MSEDLVKPKRKKSVPLTAKALEYCRKQGWLGGVVERRLPHTFTTVDLFGFIDMVVLDDKPGLLGVQVTASGDVRRRVRKIQEECGEAADRWLAAGGRIEVWGFSKRRELGGARMRWCRDITVITRGASNGEGEEERQGEVEERQRQGEDRGEGLGREAADRDPGGEAAEHR